MTKNILVVRGSGERNQAVIHDLINNGHRVEEVSVQESVEILQKEERIDLVIVGLSTGEGSALSLARLAKERGVNLFIMSEDLMRQNCGAEAEIAGFSPNGGDTGLGVIDPRSGNAAMRRISAA